MINLDFSESFSISFSTSFLNLPISTFFKPFLYKIIIVALSIIMPIYYSYQKKKKEQKIEHEKIKAYGESINQETRNKN